MFETKITNKPIFNMKESPIYEPPVTSTIIIYEDGKSV